jgi:hypothetical protein
MQKINANEDSNRNNSCKEDKKNSLKKDILRVKYTPKENLILYFLMFTGFALFFSILVFIWGFYEFSFLLLSIVFGGIFFALLGYCVYEMSVMSLSILNKKQSTNLDKTLKLICKIGIGLLFSLIYLLMILQL